MLYQSQKTEREEIETAHLANKMGIEAQVLQAGEVQKMEPGLEVRCLGGVYFPGDAHLYPNLLMAQLKDLLARQGVHFHQGKTVDGFVLERKKAVALVSNREHFSGDQFILAGGSLTGILAKQLGARLPLQDGKGYSFTLKKPLLRPRHATIFLEARVAVTPIGDDLRFGGTLELSGHDSRINLNRVRGIVESIPRHYPTLKIPMPRPEEIWYGYRPCTPDGLPYIGRLGGLENVLAATGHAMMGLSLAPATGLMIRDFSSGNAVNPAFKRFFDPNRYGV
jgi:D-amino-acid dehydrogenase